MKEEFARNISRYRKEKGLTQEELANKLNLSFQAVSKWERARALPDVTLLPVLARVLGVSVDRLLGYEAYERQTTIYEEEYKTPDYYWGLVPSRMCFKILDLMPPIRHLKLLDIGCGEGKNAVFFARNGYDVTAFDISEAGIEKTKRLAKKIGVKVEAFRADVLDFRLYENYDILFSSGVLHYIKAQMREEVFNNYKQFTNIDGLHVLNVFVKKPFIAPAPENEPTACKWVSGELFTYYYDWYIEECSEIIFDCNSSGIPHQHAMNMLGAKKTCCRRIE